MGKFPAMLKKKTTSKHCNLPARNHQIMFLAQKHIFLKGSSLRGGRTSFSERGSSTNLKVCVCVCVCWKSKYTHTHTRRAHIHPNHTVAEHQLVREDEADFISRFSLTTFFCDINFLFFAVCCRAELADNF